MVNDPDWRDLAWRFRRFLGLLGGFPLQNLRGLLFN